MLCFYFLEREGNIPCRREERQATVSAHGLIVWQGDKLADSDGQEVGADEVLGGRDADRQAHGSTRAHGRCFRSTVCAQSMMRPVSNRKRQVNKTRVKIAKLHTSVGVVISLDGARHE